MLKIKTPHGEEKMMMTNIVETHEVFLSKQTEDLNYLTFKLVNYKVN